MVKQLSGTAILWVRKDFRTLDNEALSAAANYETLVPVFIWDSEDADPWAPGAASKWWLHHTLQKFRDRLQGLGSDLLILKGRPEAELSKLATQTGAERAVEPQP